MFVGKRITKTGKRIRKEQGAPINGYTEVEEIHEMKTRKGTRQETRVAIGEYVEVSCVWFEDKDRECKINGFE